MSFRTFVTGVPVSRTGIADHATVLPVMSMVMMMIMMRMVVMVMTLQVSSRRRYSVLQALRMDRGSCDMEQGMRIEVEPIVHEGNEAHRVHYQRTWVEQSLRGSLDRGGPFVVLQQIDRHLSAAIRAMRSLLQSEDR